MSMPLPMYDAWLGESSPFQRALNDALSTGSCAALRLVEAMSYSVSVGGKRYRPYLIHAMTDVYGGDLALAAVPSCAVELVHTYSLIHDDLPSMDDDDMRRGRPSNHKAFGEGLAILAGDALQSRAFEVLCSSSFAQAAGTAHALMLAAGLAEAIGPSGMAGGQALDLECAAQTEDELRTMHEMKTGALIRYCCYAGALISGVDTSDALSLGSSIGMAFQVRDDILDATSTSEEMGKTAGKDKLQGKFTYVAAYGLEGAKQRLSELLDRSKSIISRIPGRKDAIMAAVGLLQG